MSHEYGKASTCEPKPYECIESWFRLMFGLWGHIFQALSVCFYSSLLKWIVESCLCHGFCSPNKIDYPRGVFQWRRRVSDILQYYMMVCTGFPGVLMIVAVKNGRFCCCVLKWVFVQKTTWISENAIGRNCFARIFCWWIQFNSIFICVALLTTDVVSNQLYINI